MTAAGTKLPGNVADIHYRSQSAKTAGVKADRKRPYENNECFVCGKQGHEQWDCPQSQQSKAGKGVHGRSHGQDQAAAAAPAPAPASIHKRTRLA